MELLFIFFAALGICVLFIQQCIKKLSSTSRHLKQTKKKNVVKERARMPSGSDDELVTFTISATTSYYSDEIKSNNTTKGRWVASDEVISVANQKICGGFFYFGGILPNSCGYGTDASLVDATLPISNSIDMQYQDETLDYWPSFNSISSSSRGAYLAWLASERDNPTVPLGYVFIYFYGLERRILIDSQEGNVTDAEFISIYQELQRLRSIYGFNRSFEILSNVVYGVG
ncbi:MAG: TerB N-terminal domain-containing protein [Enterovibrio sp.]